MFVRAYLRASTEDQNANRARADLEGFAAEQGVRIASFYIENLSGASLDRPELFRLLRDCQAGDVLLIEQVDRLTRLSAADWETLKTEIAARRVRIVALDLPTSWAMLRNGNADDFTGRMFDAVNAMLLDVLAAAARKDYEDRRRRQSQGIAKAAAEGKYRGRPEDERRNAAIVGMLRSGTSWSSIQAATGCSRSTLARLAKRVQPAA